MSLYKLFIVFLVTVGLASCEKTVNIKLQPSEPTIVVQGAIENGQPPYVILTTTIGTFSKIDLSSIEKFFIHDAIVKVSDGMKTIQLKEYAIDTAANARFYIYTLDTANLANAMIGQLDRQYQLEITINDKKYQAVTKIPYPKGVDTLWFGEPTFKRPKTPSNALELFANYTDPDTLGNFVRYFTKRNDAPFYAGGLFTDELVNGKFIANIDLFAGYDDSASVNLAEAFYFYPGDSVQLKWAEIDKGVYDFWNTYLFSMQAGSNPFSSPINLKTNISNGALGVWAGYGCIYYKLQAR